MYFIFLLSITVFHILKTQLLIDDILSYLIYINLFNIIIIYHYFWKKLLEMILLIISFTFINWIFLLSIILKKPSHYR